MSDQRVALVARHCPADSRRLLPTQPQDDSVVIDDLEEPMDDVHIHRYTAGPQGAFVNAYLLETGEGVIASTAR